MKILNQKVSTYNSNIHNIEKNQQKNNERVSSGKKINKASDDAAGLAIAEKMNALINGIGKGVNNTYDMQNALKTADGSLSSINDNLQRVRDLSLQASSGILNDDDKKLIQEEINQTLSSINDIAKNTQFNGQNLLDGTFTDKNVAMNADGSGTSISIGAVDTNALGLGNFSVMQNSIDVSSIDKAMNTISSARVKIGAQINRFDYAIASNSNTSLNMAASKSKIEDADIVKESMNRQTNKALSQYGIFTQKNRSQTQYNIGILNDDDKKLIQEEINQTLSSINDIAKNTQFNGQNLLDGSFTDKNVAMNADGYGTSISIGAVDTNALGLGNFSVMQNSIDMSSINKAIDAISSARVKIGAQINRFDHAIASNSNTGLNMAASKSKIEDADIVKESMNRQTNKALSQYGIFTQKNRSQTQYNMLNILF